MPNTSDPQAIKYVNEFLIIPGAPTILPNLDLQSNLPGNRILIIPRLPSMRANKLGRIVLWILKDSSDIVPIWIPEFQVQLILKQIKEFDLEKQPLAFEDLGQVGVKTPPTQRDLDSPENAASRSQTLPSQESQSDNLINKKQYGFFLAWILVGIAVFVLGVRYVTSQARR